MYVCICRVVTQTRIRAAIAAGAVTVDEVEVACGAGGDCGSCREQIQQLIDGQECDATSCLGCPKAHHSISTAA